MPNLVTVALHAVGDLHISLDMIMGREEWFSLSGLKGCMKSRKYILCKNV